MAGEDASIGALDTYRPDDGRLSWLRLEDGRCDVAFFIEGEPIAKERPRVERDSQGRPRTRTPEATATWEGQVGWDSLKQMRKLAAESPQEGELHLPFEGRIAVMLVFYLKRPRTGPGAKAEVPFGRKDVDNLAKSVIDGLQGAKIIKNDNRVTDLRISKRYADDGPEGAWVRMVAWV